nr:F-box/kelch-repeat protein At3g06240-like [Tanacetum cinerariifolium]
MTELGLDIDEDILLRLEVKDLIRCKGFGFDSSIDDYKVVIGFRNEHSKSYVFEVLTLKSNVWRSVYVESGYDIVFGNGILCNGAIHWASYRNNKKVIVSFHLSKE